MQQILKWKLSILARLYIWKYRPMIIGVTGNAGKTTTKEMIGAVVGKIKKVRISAGNLNNEFGLPLTILGNWDEEYYRHGPSLGFWLKVLTVSGWRLIYNQEYPEVLVLEYGADKPGDIKKLANKYRPHISVLTTVGDTPVHIEYFKDADAVADEKANLIKVLSRGDFAVLNHDDERVMAMQSETRGKILTYGFDNDAGIRAADFENLMADGRPLGAEFKLFNGGNHVVIRVEGSLGRSQAWSAAAAAAVGEAMGMDLTVISEALRTYRGPKGRLKIFRGIKNSCIIDDTYNASPASTQLALETLRDLPGPRKIAVLGDMLELGEHSEAAHREIGQFASQVAEIIVCVGSQAKFIFEGARAKLSAETLFKFENSADAKSKVKELIREHDLVLVKGSQGSRMEKIVAEIMAEPERAKELLVRQSRRWRLK